MNKREARDAGVAAGEEAARYCEIGPTDKAQACYCDPGDAEEFCGLCLSVAASEAEQNGRQYAGHIGFDFNAEPEGRAEGLWDAYDAGVSLGIANGVRARIAEHAKKLAAARKCLAEHVPLLGLEGLTALARLAEQMSAGEVGPAEVRTFLAGYTAHEEQRIVAQGALLRTALPVVGARAAVRLTAEVFGEEAFRTALKAQLGPDFLDAAPAAAGCEAGYAGQEPCPEGCPHPVGDHNNLEGCPHPDCNCPTKRGYDI